MLAEMIAGMLGLIKKGDLQQASRVLDRAYMDFLKEDAAFFRKLPRDNISENLMEEHNYTQGHLKVLSELFNAEAELRAARGDKGDAREYYEKSLVLLEFVEKDSTSFSVDIQSGIRELKAKIASY